MKSKYLITLTVVLFSSTYLLAQRQKEAAIENKKQRIQKIESRVAPQIKQEQKVPQLQPPRVDRNEQIKKEPPVQQKPVKIRQQPNPIRNDESINRNNNSEKLERNDHRNTTVNQNIRGNTGTEAFKDRRVARPIVRVAPPAKPFVPVNRTINYNYRERNYRPDYRRPYSFVGIRYNNFYGSRHYIPYHNSRYYYHSGFFYSPFDTYYQVVFAPVGIKVWGLPWGYRRFYVGPTLYYYYGGTYYRNYNTTYEVVEAPLGSILPELPQGAKTAVINNHKYYELNGTYYAETLRGDETWYTVVGKNGVLNQETIAFKEDPDMATIGDVLTELPEDYAVEVINNEKFYVSKGTYYKETITDNNIGYKVVAKPN